MSKQVFNNQQSNKWKITIKSLLISMILSLIFTSVSFADGGGRYKGADAWSFGVHGDTQWMPDDLTDNPNYVAVAMIERLNEELIAKDVKFVIQPGDLTDRGTAAGLYTRAEAAEELYDEGIGFFPLRGNHEASESIYYPDSSETPTKFSTTMNYADYILDFPQVLGNFEADSINQKNFGAYNFSSPSCDIPSLKRLDGWSYSFDYGKAGSNARFVFVDVENTGYTYFKPSTHEVYGPMYLYIIWNDLYNWFFTKPLYNPDGTLYKGVYDEAGILIQQMYDIDGNPLNSIYDKQRTLKASRYVTNIIPWLFNKDGSFNAQYYDVKGNLIDQVYTSTGSSFVPTWDDEIANWKSEYIYGIDGKEIPALYDEARQMISKVYDNSANELTFYDSADPETRKQLTIADLEFWFHLVSGAITNADFWSYNATYPVTDWTTPSTPSWTASGAAYPGDQQTWITNQLNKDTRGTTQAFVFSHRPLINENHVDSLFGSGPNSKSGTQLAFYSSLADNDVKFMISAHDHLYNRALINSITGGKQVQQIITQGASTKFYLPSKLSAFGTASGALIKNREIQISQEVKNFGYYIYTVDGPRVTAEYYSDDDGKSGVDGGYFTDGAGYPDGTGSLELPELNFVKKEEWGYSLNGNQTLVAQGGSYVGIGGTFNGTTASILAGSNNSDSKDLTPFESDKTGGPRALNKVVNTGWVDRPNYKALPVVITFWDILKLFQAVMINAHNKVQSDVMSIWGMGELGAEETDTYVLSMTYDTTSMYYGISNMMMIKNGKAGIATYVKGKWVNAVNENFGGKAKFVLGQYDSAKHGLGTYGIDLKTGTAWAVLNYNADFAVATNIGPACKK